VSALAEQHERWSGARERLWKLRAKVIRLPPVIVPAPVPIWGAPVNLIGLPSPRTVMKLVALRHGLTIADIIGPVRSRPIVAARHEAIALVWTHCRAISLPAVGRMFNRDHTSILHCLRKLRKLHARGTYRRAPSRVFHTNFHNPQSLLTLRSSEVAQGSEAPQTLQ
jgi:hypothetical protein